MTARLDLLSYVRLPKLSVAAAVGLANILRNRVPKGSSPAVREAASAVDQALAQLKTSWAKQSVPKREDIRPLASRVGIAWNAIRDRLTSYEALPEGNRDRVRALEIHDTVFFDGLAFLRLAFIRECMESERRIEIIDDRGLAKDLARLVGAPFLAALRASHEAYSDALGISKARVRVAPVAIADPLRALLDAISDYALQLLAQARRDPSKHEAIAFALAPIDEFRAAASRRVIRDDEDDVEAPAHVVTPAVSELRPTG